MQVNVVSIHVSLVKIQTKKRQLKVLYFTLYVSFTHEVFSNFEPFFISFYFLLCLLKVNVQTDTEFWFAAPKVSTASSVFDKPIYLRISIFYPNSDGVSNRVYDYLLKDPGTSRYFKCWVHILR